MRTWRAILIRQLDKAWARNNFALADKLAGKIEELNRRIEQAGQ